MMKRLVQIALLAPLCAAVPAASFGVNVPQTSAADYIFSAPRLTNHIHGVIVDTTNRYGVIRSEDVDWLLEAWAERSRIWSGGLGGRLVGTGPVVRRNDVIFSLDGYGGTGGWLDADAPLLPFVRFFGGYPTTTNTYAQTSYTNGWTNALSTISMSMTNGVVSVFTNSWRQQKLFPVTSVMTNVHVWDDVDYCHGLDGVPFPAYSNVNLLSWGYFGETFSQFPTVGSIAHAREILRGTRRLADKNMSFTNNTFSVSDERYHTSGSTMTRTNFVGSCYYMFIAGHSRSVRTRTPPFTADVATRFSSRLITTGGVNRVAVAAIYATGSFMYDRRNGDNVEQHFNTNAVVRLENHALDISGDKAFCRVRIDAEELCAMCAAAAGCEWPPESINYQTSEGVSTYWRFDVDDFTIIYSVAPSVKLPDW
jgi:hypothetical protein